jgi:hypothetical protein
MPPSAPLSNTIGTIKKLRDLQAEVQKVLNECKSKKEELDQRRSGRNAVIRKTIALQNFCTRMSELLESFPGIGGAAKAADQQIGGGLVSCLVSLFQVYLSPLSNFPQLFTGKIDWTEQERTRGSHYRCH